MHTSAVADSDSVLQGKLLSVGPNKAAVSRFLVQKLNRSSVFQKAYVLLECKQMWRII